MNRNRLIALAAALCAVILAGCVDDRYGPPRWDDTRYPPRHGGDYPRYHPRPPVPPMPPRPPRAPRPPFSEPVFCTQDYGRPRHPDCYDRRRPRHGDDRYYINEQ